MKIDSSQVIGLNTDQKASQVTSLSNESNFFVAVISLICDDAFTKGRQALSEISDYFAEAEGSPAEKINATFKQAFEFLKNLSETYDLLLACVCGKVLYLILEGGMEVYLKRGEKISPLNSLGASSQLISGFLQPEDKVFFATSSMTSFLGEELNKVLNLPVDIFNEEISSKIAEKEAENESLAGLLLELTEEEETVVPALSDESSSGSETQISQQDFALEKTNIISAAVSLVKKINLDSIKRIFPKTGRSRLILAGILLTIILIGIGFKYKSNQDQQRKLIFNQMLQNARDDFNSAQGLQGLNPTEAKNKLDSAKNNIGKALSLNPKDQEAQNLKKQIEDNAGSILQQFNTSDFPLFLDLDLVKKNFHADKISLNSGNLLLLDPGTKSLITINLAKKSNQILAGSEQLGEATSASINGGLAFAYSKDKGVTRVDITNQKVASVSKKDSDLGNIADIYAFAGNVYILDTANPATGSGQIWKYLPTSEGYSDKREYLSKGTKVDFSNSLRMQIESSIYVMKKGGEILRFTKGDKDNFSLGGLDKGVKDPKSFFVSSDTDNLYLLDSGNSRLLVLTKTGQFKTQYLGDKFAQATDLVVDEKDKKVYLLEGSKIYTADLK